MKFVIGDIHGEIAKLEILISEMKKLTKTPEFIFIGDYLDKGENSLTTLKLLEELRKNEKCVFLLGNHEHYWINLDEKALTHYGASTTIEDCHKKSMHETRDFLMSEFSILFQNMVLYWTNEKFLVTHSGLTLNAFQKPVENFTKEDVLFNRYDFIKSRMLYQGKRIIFGHTGFSSVYYDHFKIGIDTSACYLKEQPLTALCLDEELIINSSKQKYTLDSIPQNVSPVIPRVKPYRLKGESK